VKVVICNEKIQKRRRGLYDLKASAEGVGPVVKCHRPKEAVYFPKSFGEKGKKTLVTEKGENKGKKEETLLGTGGLLKSER